MTIYDGVMIGLVFAGFLWGAWRGFTWQVASLASLGVGYASSHQLSARIAPLIHAEPLLARSVSMLIGYVLVSGLIFVGAWLVRATLRRLRFEAFDRHLGMLLGGFEGALLGLIGTLFVVSLSPESRGPIFESTSGKVVGRIMASVGPALPDEAKLALRPFLGGDPAVEEKSQIAGRVRDRVLPDNGLKPNEQSGVEDNQVSNLVDTLFNRDKTAAASDTAGRDKDVSSRNATRGLGDKQRR